MAYRSWLGEHVQQMLDLELTGEQLDQFSLYYRLLMEGNQKLNLTAITEEKEVYIKHFYDSLTLGAQLPLSEMESVIDVGTGAGFPGIPLKIAYPHLRVVLLDSLKKRVLFLQELVDHLHLKSVESLHGRAEEVARNRSYRESFDLATARAVAKLNILSEYCLPFVRVDRWFAAMKGPDVQEEIRGARGAVQKLGGKSIQSLSMSLPENMGERHLLLIQKDRPTPRSFPRKAGTPARKPLS
ncbi:16S rRNA (guanine(527)-N(7))-methyltransferase RsmG [Melghirimyces algeriensis]|uniref:Ribosomal RNA small subunit methyltransferase G n=1 Tax=Melghirimyces algeriensis TaxID=910412 RepID=A0A521FCZ9_9BACL|nr:16S rRNA (guanine(527)-N(7))-methyltransferase RsmG [Melghirimyces algeriensis]SMO93904.1 16S rRNA m(7)G-527 methyltransferase [Melghirimyces algeriensis]